MAGIDVEDESILTAIFKDQFPDNYEDNADFAEYLAELSSYGVNKLAREPDRLAEEKIQILQQTQDLAFHNYKTFIETAECSKEIYQDFQIIERHVDSLLGKLPDVNDECKDFMKNAQNINTSRRMNNATLQRHTQLLEVLEMPQLMDTCVRNGYYEEALELAAHVKRLEKKHHNIPIIMQIVSEVEKCFQLMLNHLIHQLRSNIQLPACLRIIGYLRRMDVFTEAQLRIKFLQARDSWFQGILEGLPNDDSYYHITKTIELSRVHLFDIITQYRAIFSDEDPLLSTSKTNEPNENSLFHGWLIQKVSQFLRCLETDLTRGVGGRLDSVLGQCMYFGLSFSRVGADFRGLIAPIFQRAALSGFIQSVQEADSRLEESMQSYTLLGTSSVLPSTAFNLAAGGVSNLQPPVILLEFHPLAAYCNDLLNALNDLRLCAPISLACDVASHLQHSLQGAAHTILAYHRAEETTFNSQEEQKFGLLSTAFADELVPYMNQCLQALFPPSQLANILGITVSDLVRLGDIGLINTETVNSQIRHLVPVKEIPAPPPETEAPPTEPSTQAEAPPVETAAHTEVSPVSPTTKEAESIEPTVLQETEVQDSSGGLVKLSDTNTQDDNVETIGDIGGTSDKDLIHQTENENTENVEPVTSGIGDVKLD